MMLARLERDPGRFHAVPRQESAASKERLSDAWPDWPVESRETELAIVEKNKPSVVIREAVYAIAYSIGLVVFLMAVLSILHIR